MLWADRLEEWADSPVTEALKDSCVAAIGDLNYQMVYEESDKKLAIMQGMVRAYLDVLAIIENKDLNEKGESK